MPLKYQFSEEAEADVYEAYGWYEEQQVGLGDAFLESLDAAKEAIIRNPTAYRFRYKKKVRGFVVNRFPFLMLYIVSKKSIDVISVFHTSQQPKVWKDRVK